MSAPLERLSKQQAIGLDTRSHQSIVCLFGKDASTDRYHLITRVQGEFVVSLYKFMHKRPGPGRIVRRLSRNPRTSH